MPLPRLMILFSLLCSHFTYAGPAEQTVSKPVIGSTANFLVDGHTVFRARIDTGASRTSINASDIKVIDGAAKMRDNVGKEVEFTIINAKGKESRQRARIQKVILIKTPQGRESRYLVPLQLTWNGVTSSVDANLRDRSNMNYKLLIGRDWLDSNAVVDVNPKRTIGEISNFLIENDLEFEARIDTGAASTSINAHNIRISNESPSMLDNIGKKISFDLINADGHSITVHTTIAKVVDITNALGTEYRYKVPLKIKWQGETEILNINLRDRSKLTYMLLIGRDWIGRNVIVDVND
ncbi:hypothetical protein EDC56_0813 [Sinobacterium caligoides]|uniref:Retropepsin-like aspartic endopeptidase domain-containing protein n=1 Tax=Sinobacterium caligoides TaxID=933926 RepID=A0A3N2DZI0_9GAMM|nr:RimK/LysX family protein [Sinobacterium caligoides]ROS05283.1 hypothetical protein EDC56_0813 [Sinobacterium caligoides]